MEPRNAYHTLLRIIGFQPKQIIKNNIHRTIALSGQSLTNINLNIEAGSVVCLTGPSGAGKSVLLNLLAGVITPSSGRIEIHGTRNTLLTTGDNIDERLTAEENILHHMRAVNIPSSEMDQYQKDVIHFAELEKFERVPVRTFSTGMKMRLSIAMALHGNADVFLIDDVLGVGDIAFQKKCVDRLHALKQSGATLVLSFSDESLIRQLATRVVTLQDGNMISDNPVDEWLSNQRSFGLTDVEWQVTTHLPENDVAAFRSIQVSLSKKEEKNYLSLQFDLASKKANVQCRTLIDVTQGKLVLFRSLNPQIQSMESASCFTSKIDIPVYLLNQGIYKIVVSLLVMHNDIAYVLKAVDAVTFQVQKKNEELNLLDSNRSFVFPGVMEVAHLSEHTI